MSKKDNNIPLTFYNTYAVTCLLVAAKAVELDERIPYISKMVKYCGHEIKAEDIKETEKNILLLLDWELQTCTILDLLEFYLSQGVLFSSDELYIKEEDLSSYKVLSEKDFNSNHKKVVKDLRALEKGMKNLNVNERKEIKHQKMETFSDIHVNLILTNIEYQAYNLLGILLKGKKKKILYTLTNFKKFLDPKFVDKDIKLLVAALIAYVRQSSKVKNFW